MLYSEELRLFKTECASVQFVNRTQYHNIYISDSAQIKLSKLNKNEILDKHSQLQKPSRVLNRSILIVLREIAGVKLRDYSVYPALAGKINI